jgi:hypothetical protein
MSRLVLSLLMLVVVAGVLWGQPGPAPTPTPVQTPAPPAERGPPVLEWVFALGAVALVLTIICMPSRKR